jgi:carboxypeptidase Q
VKSLDAAYAFVRACWLPLAIVFSATAQSPGPPGDPSSAALNAIFSQATLNSHAYQNLEELCKTIGGRITGSPQDEQARRWAMEKMQAMGLKNVRAEPWQLPRGWARVYATAELTEPVHQKLTVSSMGWAGSTPGAIEAPVFPVNGNQLEDEQNQSGLWAGKILLIVSKGTPRDSIEIFSQIGPFLKAAQAAHAVAAIGGSRTRDAGGMKLTHVDPIDFSGGSYDLPMLNMAAEHREVLERLLDQGKSVRMRIDVRNRVTPGPVASANVVGEIPGALWPDQVVVAGAHLDSWDLGQGAVDDGFGAAATLAAAEAIARAGHKPRRTIRFVLFTGEEQGIMGSRAYVRQHESELANHVAAVVMDQGAGPFMGLQLNGRDDLRTVMERLVPLLPTSGRVRITDSLYLFSDAFAFTLAGVPGIDMGQDSPDYGSIHHSAADTLDEVKPENLMRNAAAMAMVAFWVADLPERCGAVWPQQETGEMLKKRRVENYLERMRLWPAKIRRDADSNPR